MNTKNERRSEIIQAIQDLRKEYYQSSNGHLTVYQQMKEGRGIVYKK